LHALNHASDRSVVINLIPISDFPECIQSQFPGKTIAGKKYAAMHRIFICIQGGISLPLIGVKNGLDPFIFSPKHKIKKIINKKQK
jgi:hypothetical protein